MTEITADPEARTRSLRRLLASIDAAGAPPRVSVGDILDEIGQRSFAPAVIAPALILVSPVSGIPGVPTVAAILIVLVTLQWMMRRDHLWLPGWLLRRSLDAGRLHRGLKKVEGVAEWIDRHSGRRLPWLAEAPMGAFVLLSIVAIAASWPFLELLPMITSIGAASVALLAFGVWVRDGLFVIAGYAVAGGLIYAVIRLAGAVM